MNNQEPNAIRYLYLEALLALQGLPMKGIWILRDVAALFSVSARTIQAWIKERKLVPRDLPGRGRFLSEDLENFLKASIRKAAESEGNRRH